MASFEWCKQLFTNGGGWYGVNSAHPFENPTPLSNFLEMLAIIVVPMAQVYMFGLLVGDKEARVVFVHRDAGSLSCCRSAGVVVRIATQSRQGQRRAATWKARNSVSA